VRGDPGAEQLVHAEPEHRADRRVHLGDAAVAAHAEDRVVGSLAAQRAVAQLGGQRRVAAGHPPLAQHRGQQQVRVGAPFLDGEQDVADRASYRIGARRAGTAFGGHSAPREGPGTTLP
jgi:hypothetical protein